MPRGLRTSGHRVGKEWRACGAERRKRKLGASPYSAASARLLLRFSFILRRPTTIAFKTAGLTPLVMSARTSAR